MTPLISDGNITSNTTSTNTTISANKTSSGDLINSLDPFQYNAPLPAYILLDGNSHNLDFEFKMTGSSAYHSMADTVTVDESIIRFVESNEHVTHKFTHYPDNRVCRNTSSSNSTAGTHTNNDNITASIVNDTGNSIGEYQIIRLTDSAARQSGAAWYPHKVNVREGFDTTFSFYLSSPSVVCNIMGDVNSLCRSRGADGLAFVLHNPDISIDSSMYDTTSPDYSMDNTNIHTDTPPILSPGIARPPTLDTFVLGAIGSGLGYDGIVNGLSVEIDTFSNSDKFDPYENHVAVMSAVSGQYGLFIFVCTICCK